jgi:hypothetical protein
VRDVTGVGRAGEAAGLLARGAAGALAGGFCADNIDVASATHKIPVPNTTELALLIRRRPRP